MKKRVFSSIISLISIFCVVGCCKNVNECLVPDKDVSKAINNDVFSFDDQHLITNSIHKGAYSYTYTDKVFMSNATSSYRIITDKSNDATDKEANNFRAKVYELFKYYLPVFDISEAGEIKNSDNNIIFATSGFDSIVASEDVIKGYGFTIKTIENSIYILAHGSIGIANANRKFLSIILGYEPLFDIDVYSLNGKTVTKSTTLYLPDCDITELPDVEFRCAGQLMTEYEKQLYGITSLDKCYFSYGNGSEHNSLSIVPYSQYGAEHPNWFTSNHKQLCYSCHGDEKEYNALLKQIGDWAEENYEKDHSRNSFFIGQMDKAGTNLDADLCDCAKCKEIKERYKNPKFPNQNFSSAVMLKFFNDLDDYVQTTYHHDKIRFIFFAYQDSMYAPYDPNNEIHAHKNVSLMIAPSRASYTHSFYDPMQETREHNYPQICRDWNSVCDTVYYYLYQVQFQSVLYPFQAHSTIIDNCRFACENGASLIYPLGDVFNNGLTGFGKFKDYLYAKGSYDANSSYSQLKDYYFAHYYGSAGEIMENLYDQIVSYLTYLGSVNEGINSGLITLPAYNNVNYWNKSLLQQWLQMVDSALALLDLNKNNDLANYEKYVSHVEIEGVFPAFALCELFQTQFSSSAFNEIAIKLAKWCRKNAINYENETNHREAITLENTRFKGWGV